MNPPFHVKEFVGTINDNPWGRTFYVQSTHVNAADATVGGGSQIGLYPKQPLKTLVKAFAHCLAGDRIIIGPNHVETISAATTFAKADVEIIGLGGGTSRPTFTFDTVVGAGFTFSKANIVLENLRFLCKIDAQTLMLAVNGSGSKVLNCDFGHDGAVQPLTCFSVTGEQAEVGHCSALFLSAGLNKVLQFDNAADQIHIHDNRFQAFCATAVIQNIVSGASGILIERNSLESMNTTAKPCILGQAAMSGQIRYNTLGIDLDAALTWIVTAGFCHLYENYGANNDGETGILEGTASG